MVILFEVLHNLNKEIKVLVFLLFGLTQKDKLIIVDDIKFSEVVLSPFPQSIKSLLLWVLKSESLSEEAIRSIFMLLYSLFFFALDNVMNWVVLFLSWEDAPA
jgi:hypothetical protein